MGSEADDFLNGSEPDAPVADPKRPEAVRGRYRLPHPETGKPKSWTRVTSFVDLFSDEYKLTEWKFRNVVKGLALMTTSADQGLEKLATIAAMDVREDKLALNRLVSGTFRAADSQKAANAGTALHKSTEAVDYAHGALSAAAPEHQVKMAMYLEAFRVNGLTIPDDMIERSIVSLRYDVSGKFDRVFRLPDGTYVIGDLKTNDNLEWSLPKYAAQLECYQEGFNAHGVWDGVRYVKPYQLRTDIGIIIHLPSTRDECHVIEVDLEAGRQINAANLSVRAVRRIEAGSISRTFSPVNYQHPVQTLDPVLAEALWNEKLANANTREELLAVVRAARLTGQWTKRLSDWARSYDRAFEIMGS